MLEYNISKMLMFEKSPLMRHGVRSILIFVQPETTVGCSADKAILFGLHMSFTYNNSGLADVSATHCSPGLHALVIPPRDAPRHCSPILSG